MEKQIRFQGRNISYGIEGSGPAVVLLHGFLESKAIWSYFTVSLKEHFTVIAVDLLGHGESEVVHQMHDMKLMAEAVKEVLMEEKISSTVVVGHSMGGYVALQLADKNESLVNGLVLFHSHGKADSDKAKANRQGAIKAVKQSRNKFLKKFFPDLFDPNHVDNYSSEIKELNEIASQMSTEAIVAALLGMRDRPARLKYLSSTENPVLFILGKQDTRMQYEKVLIQAVVPAHSEIMLLDDVGHMGMIEARDKTLKAILHFALRCYEEQAV